MVSSGGPKRCGRQRLRTDGHEPDPPLDCIAYHEAGHAAAHFAAGRRFRYVTIVASDEALGHCANFASPPGFRPDIDVSPRGERLLRDQIVSLLAGELADTRHCGRVDGTMLHVGDDHARAVSLASYVVGPDEELSAYINWLSARTTAQLARPDVWAGLEAIAADLVERRKLTYAEAAATWSRGVQAYIDRVLAARSVKASRGAEQAPL